MAQVWLKLGSQSAAACNVMQILQRGQEISNRDWKVIRVAIVAMKNSVYIGRLFFGKKETGEVAWDCDCRPSDGIWLSKQVATLPAARSLDLICALLLFVSLECRLPLQPTVPIHS